MKEILIPAGHRLVIKVDEPEDFKKNSTIVIPEKTKDLNSAATETGILIAIGDTAFSGFGDGRDWASIGDHVVFVRHAGHIRKINGQDYRVINDVDLIAILVNDNEETQNV